MFTKHTSLTYHKSDEYNKKGQFQIGSRPYYLCVFILNFEYILASVAHDARKKRIRTLFVLLSQFQGL